MPPTNNGDIPWPKANNEADVNRKSRKPKSRSLSPRRRHSLISQSPNPANSPPGIRPIKTGHVLSAGIAKPANRRQVSLGMERIAGLCLGQPGEKEAHHFG
jgi:hypothetical protein